MLTSSSIVKRKADQLLISKVDDEYLMMDIDKGAYISLNKTASIIWEQIEEPVSVEEIVNHLSERFNIKSDTCKEETLQFLESIFDLNALETISD